MGILATIVFSLFADSGVESWALERGYRPVVHEHGRVVLFVPPDTRERDIARKLLPRIEKTLEKVGKYLLPPPDDGSETVAEILELRNLEDARSLRRYITERQAWFDARDDSSLVGFVIPRPLLGAWVREVPGQEEWRPANELVNRLTQLVVLRRVGQLPFWIEQGLAWTVEQEVEGSIYCFPYRAEFVWASEHDRWDRRVRSLMAERRMKVVDLGTLASWPRATFDAESALLAWGVVHRIAREHPAQFPSILRELADLHEKQRWKKNPDGSEVTDPTYELPLEDQTRVLEKHLGEDFLEEISAALRGRR